MLRTLNIFMLLILNVGKGSKMKYNKLTILLKYVLYLIKASNGRGHGIHSPFVFSFIKKVLNTTTKGDWVNNIENYRAEVLNNKQEIKMVDLGAGAILQSNKTKKISVIARGSLKSKKYSTLLNRIVAYYRPSNVLEMGTSFGITTCYLAQAMPGSAVVTMEGAPAIAKEALHTFYTVGFSNIQLLEGNFDNSLPLYFNTISTIGLAYVDGNHSYEPTMRYFNLLLNKSNQDSIFIFDDIHWSREMEMAWKEIKEDQRVSLTIDLFYIGIVFLKIENKEKENFIIRF
jgi:predicted O-methyltransferase YrrM